MGLTVEGPEPTLLPVVPDRLDDERVGFRVEVGLLLMAHLVVLLDHRPDRLSMRKLPVNELSKQLELRGDEKGRRVAIE